MISSEFEVVKVTVAELRLHKTQLQLNFDLLVFPKYLVSELIYYFVYYAVKAGDFPRAVESSK